MVGQASRLSIEDDRQDAGPTSNLFLTALRLLRYPRNYNLSGGYLNTHIADAVKLDINMELWHHCYRLCGVIMAGKLFIGILCITILASPLMSFGASSEVKDSTYWSNLVHEENSIVASVLLIPYLIGQVPIAIIDGIVNPKPTSMSTIPPPAHRVSH